MADVKIGVGVKDDASLTLDNIAKKLKEMRKASRESGEGALEQTLSGPGGLAKAGLDYLGVGIQAVVVDQIGEAFAKSTDKLVEMQQKLREGKTDAAELANEFAKSLPILGSFVTGFENLRELITGERAEVERIKQEAELTTKIYDAQLAAVTKIKEQHEASAEILRQGANRRALSGTVGEEHAKTEAKVQYENEVKAAKDRRKEKENDPQLQASIKAAREAIAKDQERISQMEAASGGDYGLGGAAGVVNSPGAGNLKDLKEGVTQRQQELARLQAIDKQRKDNAKADEAKEVADAGLTRAQAEKKAEKEVADARAEAKRKADEELAKINAETNRVRLEAEGKAFDGRMQQLDQQKQAEISEVQSQYKKDVAAESDPQEQARIQQRAQEKIAAIKEQYKVKGAAAYREDFFRRANIQLDAREAIEKAESVANEERLRAAGRAHEANITQIKREGEERKQQIQLVASEAARNDAENAPQIQRKAEAEKANVDVETARAARRAQDAEIERSEGIRRQFAQGHIESLKAQAAMGSIVAAKEAQRAEIAERFTAKRKEYEKIIRDETSTAAEKAQARALLAGLGGQEEQAQRMANFTGGINSPDLHMSSRGSGAAQRAKEENSPFIQMQKLQEKTAKHAETTAGAITKVASYFEKNPEIVELLKGVA